MSEKVANPFVYTHKTSAGLKARLTRGETFYGGKTHATVAVLSDNGDEYLYSCKEDAGNPNHFIGSLTTLSISPINPWENVAIDTPVLVGSKSGTIRRYFAGLNTNGKLATFNDGANEWSAGEYPRTSEWFMDQVTLADGTQPTI